MGTIIAFSMIGLAFFIMGFVLYKTAIGMGGKTSLRGVAVKKEDKQSIYYTECRKLNGVGNKAFHLKGNSTFKISIEIECEKGDSTIEIKDNTKELVSNYNKSVDFEYKTSEKNRLNLNIKFTDFYGRVKVSIKNI